MSLVDNLIERFENAKVYTQIKYLSLILVIDDIKINSKKT